MSFNVFGKNRGFSFTGFSATIFKWYKIARWHCFDADNFKTVFDN